MLLLHAQNIEKSYNVKRYYDVSYIRRMGTADENVIDAKLEKLLQLQHLEQKFLSGGEQTKSRIAEAFSESNRILLADEPTSNLEDGRDCCQTRKERSKRQHGRT